MSEVTRVRRSPAEILAAKEADLANAKARAAVDAQMSHPIVQNLTGLITGFSKARTDAKKGWNGNPAQTYANRIQSHKLWIEEVEAEQAVATAQIALSDSISPLYRDLRNKAAQALADGKSAEEVSAMVTNGDDAIRADAIHLYNEIETLKGNLAIAKAARKAFLESKKAPKGMEATA